jgi:hypothetical protein
MPLGTLYKVERRIEVARRRADRFVAVANNSLGPIPELNKCSLHA